MLSGRIGVFLNTFMKRVFLLSFLAFAFLGLYAQDVKAVKEPATPEVLQIKETEHDFGMIAQGKPVYYYFEIINKGNTPLKLDNVQASCGCTTPEWKQEPIAAGASEKIKVGYNAATEGSFEKFITVTYNGSETKQIKIKGIVWKAPAGAAPANSSIQFLKQQMQ
jgi:hypothetical protein